MGAPSSAAVTSIVGSLRALLGAMIELPSVELNVPVIIKLSQEIVLHPHSILFGALCLRPVEKMPAILQVPCDDL